MILMPINYAIETDYSPKFFDKIWYSHGYITGGSNEKYVSRKHRITKKVDVLYWNDSFKYWSFVEVADKFKNNFRKYKYCGFYANKL